MATENQNVEEATPIRFEDIDGAHLIRPLKTIRAAEQLRFSSILMKAVNEEAIEAARAGEKEAIKASSLDFIAFADLIDFMIDHFAIDRDALDEFLSGPGAQEKGIVLAQGLSDALGK